MALATHGLSRHPRYERNPRDPNTRVTRTPRFANQTSGVEWQGESAKTAVARMAARGGQAPSIKEAHRDHGRHPPTQGENVRDEGVVPEQTVIDPHQNAGQRPEESDLEMGVRPPGEGARCPIGESSTLPSTASAAPPLPSTANPASVSPLPSPVPMPACPP